MGPSRIDRMQASGLVKSFPLFRVRMVKLAHHFERPERASTGCDVRTRLLHLAISVGSRPPVTATRKELAARAAVKRGRDREQELGGVGVGRAPSG